MRWKEFSLLHVLLFLSFLVSGLVINMLQLLLYTLTVTFLGHPQLFRRINYYAIYAIYGQLLFLADWWSGSTVTYYGESDLLEGLGKQHAVILMNHHYELDWLYGWMVGDRAGILGNCRVYVKKAIQYVPILGWGWGFSDTPFLARDWEQDQQTIERRLADLQDYPDPVWILLFPEGTRFTKDKYEASKKFAESRGLPVLKHHLVPRTKGFCYTVSHLDPSRVCWVYDVTLGCEQATPPTLTAVLSGRPTAAHMYIRRFRLEDIPREEVAAAAWLADRFQEKDELLEAFHTTGSFPGQPRGHQLQRRLGSLVLSLSVNSLVVLPSLYYLLTSAGWLSVLAASAVLAVSTLGIKYFIGITQISKSSSYGEKKKQT